MTMMRKTILGMLLVCLGGLASAQTQLTGAGATFPYPIYSKWFDVYKKKAGVEINYQSIGSSGGIKQVTDGTVDFGASDATMSDEQLKTYKDKHGSDLLHFPTVLGAVAVTYNIKGVTEALNFSGPTLAGIYLGKITKWNAPEIAKDNPKVKLPSDDIVVVHRAEGSGTTFCWTDYLSKVSPEWEKGPGKAAAPNWPVGLGGKGSDGVSGSVKQTSGSIGYVELIYALQNKMPVAKIKNASGAFVAPSLASVTAAAKASSAKMPDDFRVSIVNPVAKDAYPIATFTWLLIPAKIADPAKKKAIVDFLKWMLADGQKMTEALDFSQLPAPVVAKEVKAITKVM
jgi:phosphate transport system substrate-binding protein